MRILTKTALVLGFFAASAVAVSCGKDTESGSLASQNNLIESYITTNRLTDSVVKAGDLWYYRFKPSNGKQIQVGSKVSLQYVLNVVSSSTYLMPYATNIKSVAVANKLDTIFVKFEPLTVEVGKSGLFKGFDLGLQYLKEGDAALILFPSTYGYEGEPMGIVPANSPLGIRVYISKVE